MSSGLSLTRKKGESISFFLDGKEVVLTVDKIFSSKVRIRVIAHESVEILRGELIQEGGVE
jgi:sRNA-binding carbon storage regulator CsrA